VQIVSIGEVLWDVFGQAEFLGGAPLNFSAAAHRLGNSAIVVSSVGADARGLRTLEGIRALGLSTDFVQIAPDQETCTAVVSSDEGGNASFLIKRPAAFDCVSLDDSFVARLSDLHPDWIYFGTLAQTSASNEDFLRRLVRKLPETRCFYDINLRTGHWNLPLVQRLSGFASVIKLNETEAEVLFALTLPSEPFSLERFCRHWSSTYGADTFCVTLGAKGCAIYQQARLQYFPGFSVNVADTVGAGDAFAAGFLHGLGLGWTIEKQAMFANALGAIVASRPGATPFWTVDECLQLAASPPAERCVTTCFSSAWV